MIELLVASSVLILLLSLLLSATNSASTTIRYATVKIEAFSSARAAFDIVSQKLSQATLNTYWDYYDASGNRRTSATAYFVPATYGRASDLQFLVRQNKKNESYGQEIFFQAPEAFSANLAYQSTQGLLNACGFFVRYGSNATFRPNVMKDVTGSLRWRYRLMGVIESTENFNIYQKAPTDDTSWADAISSEDTDPNDSSKPLTKPLVDNVIALIAWPRLSLEDDPDGTKLTDNYSYDSQNSGGATATQRTTFGQLPPTVQVTMVIIDEASASRLDTGNSSSPKILEDALKGKFRSVSQYQRDLDDLGTALSANHINYQILNTSVILRESKWSQ